MLEPDLYALVIELHPPDGTRHLSVSGAQVQGLFFELVRQSDPELANLLHADLPGKPFTVAVLPSQRSNAAAGALIQIRVSLLQTGLFPTFIHALLSQFQRPALRLGQVPMQVGHVWGTPGSHRWAGYTTYTALASQVQPARWVRLQFATPTAVAQGPLPDGRKRLELLPTPAAVFGSLARRWNQLAPPDQFLDDELLAAACNATLVAEHRLYVRSLPGTPPQRGFVGWCSYELPRDSQQQRVITLLADAALYLGVGAKTTRGQGLCRRVDGDHAATDAEGSTDDTEGATDDNAAAET